MLANEVFTPTTPAGAGYVARDKEADDLRAALGTVGTQIVLYGESGAGKSTLAAYTLHEIGRDFITTRCTSRSDYTWILTSAFDQLGGFSTRERSSGKRSELSATASAGVNGFTPAKLEGGAKVERSTSGTDVRIVDPQRTEESLVKALVAKDLTWLIEDVHKVSPEVKEQLADALKVFSDFGHPKTAAVLLGASETASALIKAPADMKKRLSRIAVPTMTDEQLGEIIDHGGRLLNVDFSEVRDSIIRRSVGVASVTHALALRCLQAMKVDSGGENFVKVTVAGLVEAERAYARTMQGDTKEAFEKALYLRRERKYNNCALILEALAALPATGGSHADLLNKIHRTKHEYPASNLSSLNRP